jgi:hypothetical protein
LAPPALPGFPATMTLSEAQASRRPAGCVGYYHWLRASSPDADHLLNVLCSIPRWIVGWYFSVLCTAPRAGFSQLRTGLPGPNTGRHPRLNFSRLAQASLSLRPVDLLTHRNVGLVGRLRRRPLPIDAASQLLRHTDILLRRDLHPAGVPRCKSALWVPWVRRNRQRVGILLQMKDLFDSNAKSACNTARLVCMPSG